MENQAKTLVRCMIRCGDKFLILKRSSNESPHTEQYELPGGKLQFGEDTIEGLNRELNEEISRNFSHYSIIHAYAYTLENLHVTVITYEARTKNCFKPQLSAEHTEFQWVSIEDASKYEVTEQLRSLLDEIADKNTTNLTEVKLYTDGGSRGNPGPSALGYAITDMDDNVVKKGSEYLGITTNNQAEYQAVNKGLKECLSSEYDKVNVFVDSQLVANQMNGIYKIKNRDLWPIHQSIKQIASKFKLGVTFTYIPREYNKMADKMVNVELDKQKNSS